VSIIEPKLSLGGLLSQYGCINEPSWDEGAVTLSFKNSTKGVNLILVVHSTVSLCGPTRMPEVI
jgi:hypothetical protein